MRTIGQLGVALTVGALISGSAGAQQAPPSTDVFLARLTIAGGRVAVGPALNVTQRAGYDNQPSFTPDGTAILFTSVREDAQADIYRYDIATRSLTRLTSTPESEYSATVMPVGDRFSVIRVERDSTQRLWSFRLDGSDPRLVLDSIKPVGYHAWVDDRTLALFVLGNPNSLQVASPGTGTGAVVAQNIGRSLVRAPGVRTFSYLQRADSVWWLWRAQAGEGELTHAQNLGRMPPGADYVAWLPDGRVLSASGTQVLLRAAGTQGDWTPIADLASQGISRISRLTVSPDGNWLAFVAEPR
jgi:WD40 repeat protein